MKEITILTYNIGHLCLLQPWKHFYIGVEGKVFFWHKDIAFLQSMVTKIKPDIVFLQELNSVQDVELLAEKFGFTYFSYCQVSHLKHQHLGTGILHNFPDAQVHTESHEVSLHSLAWWKYLFTNVHFDPFSKRHRARQFEEIIAYVQKNKKLKHIIGWDFNISKWNGRWLNSVDKNSYKLITNVLYDAIKSIKITHKLRYKYDHFFVSPGVDMHSIDCIHKVHGSMDHYPVSGVIRVEAEKKKDIIRK
jgi:endonuclease/exonuclease/phosphatase family metal-dependent hydrolase